MLQFLFAHEPLMPSPQVKQAVESARNAYDHHDASNGFAERVKLYVEPHKQKLPEAAHAVVEKMLVTPSILEKQQILLALYLSYVISHQNTQGKPMQICQTDDATDAYLTPFLELNNPELYSFEQFKNFFESNTWGDWVNAGKAYVPYFGRYAKRMKNVKSNYLNTIENKAFPMLVVFSSHDVILIDDFIYAMTQGYTLIVIPLGFEKSNTPNNTKPNEKVFETPFAEVIQDLLQAMEFLNNHGQKKDLFQSIWNQNVCNKILGTELKEIALLGLVKATSPKDEKCKNLLSELLAS